ncbi:MAG: hypothetical protein ACF8CQ_02560 [Rhodopirellula sp. JB044]|uniref:hypothetical protein n=1 Tax=Rhodopirellula sp. JB044 TaxID=3342844 RepID=UPI00370C3D8B
MSLRETYLQSVAGALRQGEILSDVVQVTLDVAGGYPNESEEHPIDRVVYPFAVVASQDCDLDWDYKNRVGNDKKPDKELPSIWLLEAFPAQAVRDRKDVNRNVWNFVSSNKHERYHFLETIPLELDLEGQGIQELTLDFKRYFCLPSDELYAQLNSGQAKRRCRLSSPYLEHLSARLAYYQSRVALPLDHESEPAG